MIVTLHHMPLVWGFTMTGPHHEDWLRLQGQTPGKHHLLRWDSVGMQPGGEDCPGLWGLTSGTTAGARITCGGIDVAKIVILSSRLVPSPGWPRRRLSLKLLRLIRSKLKPIP